MQENIKEIKKTENKKMNQFKSINELSASEINSLDYGLVVFTKEKAKNSNQVFTTIKLEVADKALQRVTLRNGDKNLSQEDFEIISLTLELPDTNERGYKINKWEREVPVRYVMGEFKSDKGELIPYYSVDVFFNKELTVTHYFTPKQTKIINLLEKKNIHNFNWVKRPDSIKQIEIVDIED